MNWALHRKHHEEELHTPMDILGDDWRKAVREIAAAMHLPTGTNQEVAEVFARLSRRVNTANYVLGHEVSGYPSDKLIMALNGISQSMRMAPEGGKHIPVPFSDLQKLKMQWNTFARLEDEAQPFAERAVVSMFARDKQSQITPEDVVLFHKARMATKAIEDLEEDSPDLNY
jgi:hypothetical protein